MICDQCQYSRRCVNGRYCMLKRVYIEHRIITRCEEKEYYHNN